MARFDWSAAALMATSGRGSGVVGYNVQVAVDCWQTPMRSRIRSTCSYQDGRITRWLRSQPSPP